MVLGETGRLTLKELTICLLLSAFLVFGCRDELCSLFQFLEIESFLIKSS